MCYCCTSTPLRTGLACMLATGWEGGLVFIEKPGGDAGGHLITGGQKRSYHGPNDPGFLAE